MKTNIYPLFFWLLLFQGSLFAQNDSENQTLFGENGLLNASNTDLFISPSYLITQMDGGNSTIFNLRGGIGFKDTFTVGAYFATSHNESIPESETTTDVYMEYWSVGGFFEYTLLSKKVLHLTFPLYVGYGQVEMYNTDGIAGLGNENFYQIEPSVVLEINLFSNARFNIGAGYRFVGEMEYRNINQSDLSGLSAYFGLKFGLF